MTCFCYEFVFKRSLRGADNWQTKTNKFAVKFSRIFRWRRALSSKVFHWFHVAKCYSELKNEELSWKKLAPKLFGKLSYWSRDYNFHQIIIVEINKSFFLNCWCKSYNYFCVKDKHSRMARLFLLALKIAFSYFLLGQRIIVQLHR